MGLDTVPPLKIPHLYDKDAFVSRVSYNLKAIFVALCPLHRTTVFGGRLRCLGFREVLMVALAAPGLDKRAERLALHAARRWAAGKGRTCPKN